MTFRLRSGEIVPPHERPRKHREGARVVVRTPTQVLLLRDTDRLRFVPDGQNATSATISWRAWDQSGGLAGTRANTASHGGSSAYSDATDTGSITVTAVNDAPVLATATPTLATIDEDDQDNAGQTVASFLGSTISDVDSGALGGIAIHGVRALGIAATGAGGPHHGVLAGQEFLEAVRVEFLDIRNHGCRAAVLDVLDLRFGANHRVHPVPVSREDLTQLQGHLAMASDDHDVRHG